MTRSEAMRIVKGWVPDLTEAETLEAWQLLVDDGSIWQMGEPYSQLAACYIVQGMLTR